MERFCDYRRRVPLPEANQARHFIEHQLELSTAPRLTDKACGVVEGYNEDDCRATGTASRVARKTCAPKSIASGTEIRRPEAKDTSPSEEVTAHQQRVAALFDALTGIYRRSPRTARPEQAAAGSSRTLWIGIAARRRSNGGSSSE